jgi:hypothetical protein
LTVFEARTKKAGLLFQSGMDLRIREGKEQEAGTDRASFIGRQE